MASRDINDLTASAKTAWLISLSDYAARYPAAPQPFITCTHRSKEEQAELYAQGRTKAGKVVTNAKPGQSNHNKMPSPAFDIAFKKDGKLYWDVKLFKDFASIALLHGLSWGGHWQRFKDYPHFEVKE